MRRQIVGSLFILLASLALSQPPIPVGARVEVVLPPLRVRDAPGLQTNTIGVQEERVSGTILSDPYYADGYWWFQIDYDSGPDGWSAHGDGSKDFFALLPEAPAAAPTTVSHREVFHIQPHKLTASDAASNDIFGASVSIDGDYAIVGAFGDDPDGAAYVFRRSGGWAEVQKLTVGGAEGLGISVDMSSDYAIVGSPFESDNGNSFGSAYIFERGGDSWSEVAKLAPNDLKHLDSFGSSVVIDSNGAIVGTSGAAYVYRPSGDDWIEVEKLTPSDGEVASFGEPIAISGDYAIIGDGHILRRSGDSWSEVAKLSPSDGGPGGFFGVSVAISGDYAIVGDNRSGPPGAAYVYKRNGDSWVEVQKLTPGDAKPGDGFGTAVALDGDYAVIGAFGNKLDSLGSVYVFERGSGGWVEVQKLTANDAGPGDAFGTAVALDSDYVIVGAKYADNGEAKMGSAYIFSRYR